MPLSSIISSEPAVDNAGILRISIAGEWETQEFGELLRCVTFLYRVSAAESFVHDDPEASEFNTEMALINSLNEFCDAPAPYREWTTRKPRSHLQWHGSPAGVLRVARIHYSSPGVTDFAGMGKALEKVCEFLKYVIELGVQAKARRLDVLLKEQDVEAKRIENAGKKIQNAARLLELAKTAGCSPEIQRSLLFSVQEAQESLFELSENGKIVKVEKLENK